VKNYGSKDKMNKDEIIDKFELVVEELDNYFGDTILKHKLPANLFISIVMARLTIMAKMINGEDEFLLLLDRAKERIMYTEKTPDILH
jgi:hypothetical protein